MLSASIFDNLESSSQSCTNSLALDSANALQLNLIVSQAVSALVKYGDDGRTIDFAIELVRG